MMKNCITNKYCVVAPNVALKAALELLSSHLRHHGGPKCIIVVDEDNIFYGLITDGDIRRRLSENGKALTVNDCLKSEYFVVRQGDTSDHIRKLVTLWRNKYEVRLIPVLSAENKLVRIIDCRFLDDECQFDLINVFGLGFVGLTLAVFCAEHFTNVNGFELDRQRVTSIRSGVATFHEAFLNERLQAAQAKGTFTVQQAERAVSTSNAVHIIAVGTSVNDEGGADLDHLKSVCQDIGKILSPGDTVLLRSTVPVTTCRDLIIPLLERVSGYVCSVEFFVAFTPERTIEGNALSELATLPQIIGGFSRACANKAMRFWSYFGIETVLTESLEAAELVKLINNSFRDLSFAFSNECAIVCESLNIDTFRLIENANYNYPRNKIPKPSPGVGGYCLTKDPILYSNALEEIGFSQTLSNKGRAINNSAANFPINALRKFCQQHSIAPVTLKVLVVGVAFKGRPDTSDARFSSSLIIGDKLREFGIKSIFAHDAIMSHEQIKDVGYQPFDFECSDQINAIFILNDQISNASYVSKVISLTSKVNPIFLFDGWHDFYQFRAMLSDNIHYATIGKYY